MPTGMHSSSGSLTGGDAPITPQLDELRQQRVELPAPKALLGDFDRLHLEDAEAPAAPALLPEQQQRGKAPADESSSGSSSCSSSGGGGGGGGGDDSAVAPAEGATQLPWQQANHDQDEPILQPNSERFCLLPVK